MVFDRLTWVGLMIVALGWALLLSGATAMEAMVRLTGHAVAPSFNLSTITQATILTGFGLAILGALQTGFSTLKKFFDTILERTARSGPTRQDEPARSQQPPQQPPRSVVERGLLKDRPYILFGDGSLEVKTLLGVRRFTSLLEAHEFIGG